MFSAFESFRKLSLDEASTVLDTVEEEHVHPAVDSILFDVRREEWYKQSLTVLVIGASGDLAKKKTYPALFELWKAKLLPASTTIRGFARTPNSHEQLRSHIKPYLLSQQKGQAVELVDEFLNLCFYNNGKSYGDWEVIRDILSSTVQDNLLVYLAIPPNIFGESCQAMKLALADVNSVKVPGFKRIILEKPFGNDTQSCRDLLQVLKDQEWDEKTLYRIDHYLGKEIVQAIPVFRRYNDWLTPLWNKNVIKSVHLIFKEPFGTDGRGGYFDPYGIIRDILQNHLLQVLTLVAMELPEKWTSDEVRNAKVDVLKNIAPIKLEDCLLGQYNGYKLDPTIENKDTTTPTYACLKASINTPTWLGVPFIMEAGKALDERVCEARLYFRGGNAKNCNANALVFRLQPSPAVFFTSNMKTPGFTDTPVSTHIGVDYEQCKIPEAYTKLVLDVLRGKQENFVRDDELMAAWEIFTPLLHRIENDPVNIKPYIYEEGSEGPDQREMFLQKQVGCESHLPIPSAL